MNFPERDLNPREIDQVDEAWDETDSLIKDYLIKKEEEDNDRGQNY